MSQSWTKKIGLFSVLLMLTCCSLLFGGTKEDETLKKAATVVDQMFAKQDISAEVLAKANCILVLPEVKKFGIGIGGSGGRGAMSCRRGADFTGSWSAPAIFSIGGASIGLQVGGSSTDFVLLVMNQKGMDALLKGKVKLGRDATAAAGPSGATSANLGGTDMLSYARTGGLFAGMSLGGASIEPDDDANKDLYDKPMSPRDIMLGSAVQVPPAAKPLISTLDSKVAKHGK